MDKSRTFDLPSVHVHKRQFALQILVPFLVAAVLILAAAVLVASGPVSAARTWADISIIWLIAPMLVFALLFVLILGLLIYGIARLLQVTPRYTGKAQGFFALLSGWIHTIADATAKPFIWFQQAGAILKSIFKS
jgi:hypothetical protein